MLSLQEMGLLELDQVARIKKNASNDDRIRTDIDKEVLIKLCDTIQYFYDEMVSARSGEQGI